MSVWGEHGTAKGTNPWEVLPFSRFSGFGSCSFRLLFECPVAVFFFLIYSYIIWLPTICLIRVADEFHSTQTKKNKEWQEKLPIVVLKAEEILYSKANSEVFPSWFCLKDFGSLSLSLFLCLFSFKIFIFTLFHCSGWVHESWYVTGPCKWCR